MAEERVLNFLREQNKPFNVQGIADMLAQFGVKKPHVQRAVQAMSDAGKLTCKEFGKTQIYFAKQEDLQALSREEMEAKVKAVNLVREEVKKEEEVVRALTKELQDTQSSLTLDQINAKIAELAGQVARAEEKLAGLRGGAILISREERAEIEKSFTSCMSQWAKRKRIFKDVWNALSENMEQNQADFFEELGIETDEAADCDHKTLSQLFAKKARP